MRAMISKSFFGVPEDDEGFNLPAAVEMYQRVAKMAPEAAAGFLRAVVFEVTVEDLRANAAEAQRGVDRLVAKRLEDVSQGIVRTYVGKRRGGEDVTSMVEVSKAVAAIKDLVRKDDDDKDPFKRDRHGRFAHTESRTHEVKYDLSNAKKGALHPKTAQRVGIPAADSKSWSKMSTADQIKYQQAHLQVADMLRDARKNGLNARVEATWDSKDGAPFTTGQVGGSYRLVDPEQYAKGNSITGLKVTTTTHDGETLNSRDASVGGAVFNTVEAMGHPIAAQALGGFYQTGAGNTGRVKTFDSHWNDQANAANPSNRFWRRLGAGSALLQDSLGDYAPNSLKLATQAGRWAGEYGPEAQKVIGPAADKTAYRYRGTEKTPSPGIQSTVNGLLATHTPDAAREKMIYGTYDERGNHNPSRIVDYFRRTLPSKELSELQWKSGNIPPSQGVIINRKGQVVTEAVGYGDDHYLPFNLKNLGRLKGGEYIRTRTYGGPTTEDIYTGLVGNARALTVVSHNGTYTVEFDDTFRGSRRYNDKAARMVTRYGQLLDAVKNGQVKAADIPQSRMAEIVEQANATVSRQYDPERWQSEFTRLKDYEREDPRLSKVDKEQAKIDYLNTYAEKIKTGDGQMLDWRGLADVGKLRELQKIQAEMKAHGSDYSPEEMKGRKERLDAEYETPDQVAAKLGIMDKVEAAVMVKEAENRRAMKPLALDGPGYEAALKGLQEQFPYYISRVHYEPFRDGAPAKKDSGYVNPGRNRPVRALSGYFDRTIGYDKISAQDTRFQVRGGRKETPLPADLRTIDADHEDKVTGQAPPQGPVQQKGTPHTEDAHQARVMDLMNAWREVRKQTEPYGSDAGRAARMPHVWGKTEAEALEMAKAQPDKFSDEFWTDFVRAHETMGQVGGIKGYDDIAEKIRPGSAEKPVQKYSFKDALAAPDNNWDFGIKKGLPPEVIAQNADNDLAVKAAQGFLDNFSPDEDQINKGLADIQNLYQAKAKWLSGDGGGTPPHFTPTHEQAYEGLLRMKVYRKRLAEANQLAEASRVRTASEVVADQPRVLKQLPDGSFADVDPDGDDFQGILRASGMS